MVWRPSWLNNNETDDDKKKREAEEEKKLFDTAVGDAVKKQMEPINEKLKGLDSIVAFVDSQKKKDEDAAARLAAEEEEKKRKNNTQQVSNEDLAALMISDPTKAVNLITQGQQKLILQTSATQVKNSVFGDRADEFPYYAGDVKAEVDKILSEQNLQFQNDPTAVANTYYTVVGRKQKEISEGKIKSRFASSSGSTGGSGRESESTGEVTLEINEDMRRAARLSGMSIDDYKKLAEKAAKDGQLEYV